MSKILDAIKDANANMEKKLLTMTKLVTKSASLTADLETAVERSTAQVISLERTVENLYRTITQMERKLNLSSQIAEGSRPLPGNPQAPKRKKFE